MKVFQWSAPWIVLILLVCFQVAYADEEAGKVIHLSGTTVNGEAMVLPSTGHPYTMVLVFATWCPICLGELPALEKFYEQHRRQGFLLVGLSEDTDSQALQQLITRDHLSFPILQRLGQQIVQNNLEDLGVTPVTYLVDSKGRISWRRVGAVDDLLSR